VTRNVGTPAPLLEELADDTWDERYPTITKLKEVHPSTIQLDRPVDTAPYLVWDALDRFEFDLERIFDGRRGFIEFRGAAGEPQGGRFSLPST
jgi:hypothetical protein